MSLPVTFHRVLHHRLGALKPESRVELRDAKVKGGFCYWPLDRARSIACFFPDAAVDPVGLYEKDFTS